jgi:hypothetical protein
MPEMRIVANCIRMHGFRVVCDWRIFECDAKGNASEYMVDVADMLKRCKTPEDAADTLRFNNNDGSWHVIKGLCSEFLST